MNEHLVGEYLWKSCENFGPLTVHSCFSFESFYGELLKVKRGTHHYQQQMLTMNGIHNAMQHVINYSEVDNSSPEGKFLEQLGIQVKFKSSIYFK
jgi:tRNA isopentenyl-2-thiomethyl-A-37 hydroxylase MiaE